LFSIRVSVLLAITSHWWWARYSG